VLSGGEGWHNNHHAHPTSARHGLTWYEIDLNWYGIWTLQKLGLAKDIYKTTLPAKQKPGMLIPTEVLPADAATDLVSV
jgi:fatty-acid desaturase